MNYEIFNSRALVLTNRLKLLSAICLLCFSFFMPPDILAADDEEDNTKIVTLKEFPLRRLNYMYSNFVVPTIFSNNGGAFVSGVMGEFIPLEPEEYGFGVRTIQAYGADVGMTLSLLFDAYKSYSFERPARFEINSGLGLGFNTPYLGLHLGLFGQFAIKDFKPAPENDVLGPAGPVAENDKIGEEKLGLRGDWYGYYKILNIFYFKTIFNDYSKSLTDKENIGLLGGAIGDFLGVDYYPNIESLIGSLRLSSFSLRQLGGYKSDDIDFNFDVRGGYDRITKEINEYAVAADLILFRTISGGIEYNKSDFTESHLGFTAGYVFFMTADNGQISYLKLFYFKSYTPYVLQFHAEQGLLFEWRMLFSGTNGI